MKTTKSIIALLFVLLATQAAFAWYDPSTQRWLTRDPIGEPGFEAFRTATATPQLESKAGASSGRWIKRDPALQKLNLKQIRAFRGFGEIKAGSDLYEFVKNNPINSLDSLGLFCLGGPWCNWCIICIVASGPEDPVCIYPCAQCAAQTAGGAFN